MMKSPIILMAEVFFLLFQAYGFQPRLSAGQERSENNSQVPEWKQAAGRMLGIM
jgi:hypothetical protein